MVRRPSCTPAAALLALAACGDVVIDRSDSVDDGGAPGGSTSTGATSSATSGSSGQTVGTGGAPDGAGGAGGDAAVGGHGGGGAGGEHVDAPCAGDVLEEYEPVAACPALEWVGEPSFTLIPKWPRHRIFVLDDGDVGLLYVHETGEEPLEEGDVVQRRIIAPFAAWPPSLGEEHVALGNNTWAVEPYASARGDGTFSVATHGVGAVGRFGEPGVMLQFDLGTLALDPDPGRGGYLVGWGVVDHFASVDAGAVGSRVHEFGNPCTVPSAFVADDGDLRIVLDPEVESCSPTPTAVSLGRVSPEGSAAVTTLDLGSPVRAHALVPRPGGAWLAVMSGDAQGRVCAVPLDTDGGVAGPPLRGPGTAGHLRVAPWREGLAFMTFGGDGWDLTLTDGVGLTRAPLPSMPNGNGIIGGHPLDLVASADGRSILLAAHALVDGEMGILLARADCRPE